jgi:membrane protease YdiL (CAAX protease family)
VPAEFWTETAEMATAGAIVAGFAVPVGSIAWAVARRRAEPLLPRWKLWRVPWGGFEVTFAFLFVAIVVPVLLMQVGLSEHAAVVVALPLQFAMLYAAWQLFYPLWRPPWQESRYAGLVAVAVGVSLVLTPLVLMLYAGVTQVFIALEWPLDKHPLAKFRAETLGEQVLFLLKACVAAPLVEEVLFRGVLLPWVIGTRERNAGGLVTPPVAPPRGRPLLVMGAAALYTASTSSSEELGPVIFAGVLTLGLAVVWFTVRRGKRHVRGVYASAALFAVVHSAVWPSPIPLFVLGLGLGWLAVRTRGFLAPAIVHGLFNAVSAVFVLRGGAV